MRAQTQLAAGVTMLVSLAAAVCIGSVARTAVAQTPSAATILPQQAVAPSRFVLAASEVAGLRIAEVSGLAWDADEKLLYGVSDQGYIYHFRVQLDGNELVRVNRAFAAALADPAIGASQAGSRKPFNAEGLTVRHGNDGKQGNSELIVALEEKPPQIARFAPTGSLLDKLPVPAPANELANYRKKGRGLESVALHPAFGLMTAPESPLKDRPDTLHTVYADGHAWSFARHADGSRLKGIEVLPDGTLLVLERTRPGSSKDLLVASLRRVDLATCGATVICKTRLVTALPAGPENFEGLTLLDARHALIASDSDSAQGTVFKLIVLP